MKTKYFILFFVFTLFLINIINIETVKGNGIPECFYGESAGYTILGGGSASASCSKRCAIEGLKTTGATWQDGNYWYCDDFSDCSSNKPNRKCYAPGPGECGEVKDSCSRGSLINEVDTSAHYNWSCSGFNGGDNVSCSLEKPCVYISDVTSWGGCTSDGYQYADKVVWSTNNNITVSDPACKNVPTVKACIFDSCTTMTVSDIENNTYNIVNIGEQTWMAENLKTTKYNDGSIIKMTGTDLEKDLAWYNNNLNNKNIYGGLYNYSAINTNKICPVGWRVPNQADWETLFTWLGGTGEFHTTGIQYDGVGGKLKTINRGGTNEYNFSAKGGGKYDVDYGSWMFSDLNSSYWSVADSLYTSIYVRSINDTTQSNNLWLQYPRHKDAKFSVRCVKNVSCDFPLPACGTANGVPSTVMPTSNLCASGVIGPSSGTTEDGTNRWFWGCVGQNTGWPDDTAWCFAPKITPPDPDLSVSCYGTPNSAPIGTLVTWQANASGGNGSYTYRWWGTDSLTGSNQSTSKTYDNISPNPKLAFVEVNSNGITTRVSCRVTIIQPPSSDDPIITRTDPDNLNCGGANGRSFSGVPPTSLLCKRGSTPTSVDLDVDGITWRWECRTATKYSSCSATKPSEPPVVGAPTCTWSVTPNTPIQVNTKTTWTINHAPADATISWFVNGAPISGQTGSTLNYFFNTVGLKNIKAVVTSGSEAVCEEDGFSVVQTGGNIQEQ